MARKRTDYIIIHCAATRPSMDIGAKEIDLWHRRDKGYNGIGYHFVIRRNGKVEKGREQEEIGAHTFKYNDKSIGVCLVGGVTETNVNIPEDNFTPAQWASLKELVSVLKAAYHHADIVGHNNLDLQKACPSFDVGEWLDKEQMR